MNTPYPEATHLSATQALAFHAWTAANRRAADEYAAHPTAACIEPDCTDLGLVVAGFCAHHALLADLCIRCQVRPPSKHASQCDGCARSQSAAARMRRRRANERPADKERLS